MFKALLYTILSETLVLSVLRRKSFGEMFLLVLVIELFTHPVSMYFHYYLGMSFFAVEAGVVLIEAFMYVLYFGARTIKEASYLLLISFFANTASFCIMYFIVK
jgi:hypothetical protein